jgi:hypothetical protein
VRDGPERPRVTITVGTLPATPTSSLRELRLGAATNALLDVPAGPSGATGDLTVRLPSAASETTNFVRRAAPRGAATVPLVIVDECGEFQTFVVGGPAAF